TGRTEGGDAEAVPAGDRRLSRPAGGGRRRPPRAPAASWRGGGSGGRARGRSPKTGGGGRGACRARPRAEACTSQLPECCIRRVPANRGSISLRAGNRKDGERQTLRPAEQAWRPTT